LSLPTPSPFPLPKGETGIGGDLFAAISQVSHIGRSAAGETVDAGTVNPAASEEALSKLPGIYARMDP